MQKQLTPQESINLIKNNSKIFHWYYYLEFYNENDKDVSYKQTKKIQQRMETNFYSTKSKHWYGDEDDALFYIPNYPKHWLNKNKELLNKESIRILPYKRFVLDIFFSVRISISICPDSSYNHYDIMEKWCKGTVYSSLVQDILNELPKDQWPDFIRNYDKFLCSVNTKALLDDYRLYYPD